MLHPAAAAVRGFKCNFEVFQPNRCGVAGFSDVPYDHLKQAVELAWSRSFRVAFAKPVRQVPLPRNALYLPDRSIRRLIGRNPAYSARGCAVIGRFLPPLQNESVSHAHLFHVIYSKSACACGTLLLPGSMWCIDRGGAYAQHFLFFCQFGWVISASPAPRHFAPVVA